MINKTILIIKAISPVHNGAGEGIGAIDRAIARERITNFPIIQGTSIKGVLRDSFSSLYKDNSEGELLCRTLFGPDVGSGEEHAGAISFSESKLLAFPVRSLRGPFVWTASPLALYRLAEMLTFSDISLGKEIKDFVESTVPLAKTIIPEGSSEILLGSGSDRRLVLEEFSLEVEPNDILAQLNKELANLLFTQDEKFLKEYFLNRFVILPDDMFSYFITNATEVMPNIQIGGKGTTTKGSLRYSEYLPEETILFSLVTFGKGRGTEMSEEEVASEYLKSLPEITQLGADETTGKGIVKIKKLNEAKNGN